MASIFFKECFLQNIYHYDTLEIWEKLKVGQPLFLDLNEKKIVLVYEKEKENEKEHKFVGELSDDDAKFIYDILKAGHKDVFEGFISYISKETADENKRLKVVIKITGK